MNPQFKDVVVRSSAEELAEYTAEYICNIAQQSTNESFHIALSGGSTPLAVFKILAEKFKKSFPMEKVHLWWGDDRCVPALSDESNFGNAFRLWLKVVGFPESNIHPIQGENDPDAEAIEYELAIRRLVPIADGVPRFDFIMLGLGTDGHTASIFPHQIELMGNDKLCVAAIHPDSGQRRISFTGKLINNANEVVFVAGGSSKQQILNDLVLMNDRASTYPSSLIMPSNGKLRWFIDQSASVDFKQ